MVQYHLTDILVDFKKKYSKKNVTILEGDTIELKEALLHKKCSPAFLRDSAFTPIEDTIFEKISYTTDKHFDASLHGHNHNLKMIPLIPSVQSNTYLCYLKGSHLNATAQKLIAYIKDYQY